MRIILFLLKCLVGLFATLGFLLVAVAIGLGLFWKDVEGLRTARVEVPDRAVLTLDLAEGLVESRPDNIFSRASIGDVIVLREALLALERAGRDPRVEGLLVHVGQGSLGLAQAQELRDAIADFRKQGKFAVAFAESFGEAGHGTVHYYLASAADRIWLQPSGDLDLTGFMIQGPYLRAALDRIGVEPQLAQREEYKGIMNTFTDTALPAPQRENLQRLVDSWLGQVAAGVGEGRGLAPAQVVDLVDDGPYGAAEGRDLGLIDQLGYWDQVYDSVLERAGAGAEFLDLQSYRRASAPEDEKATEVALVYGLGEITLADGEYDPVFGEVVMGAHAVANALSDAIDDPDIAAIVFRVDSPGGSYVASDTIWREVQRARDEGKPLIISMGDVAASGGYFVAAPAHRIVAQPGTVTGSIGIVAGKLALEGLWEKLSITWDGVKAGENADIWSGNSAFTPENWERLQTLLDRSYADFTDKVAAGRGLSPEAVQAAAKGQVWSGEDARGLGLVDALGGYRTALGLVRESIDLAADAPVAFRLFPEERDPFEVLLESVLAGEIRSPALKSLARGYARLAGALAPLVEALETLTGGPRVRTLQAPDLQPTR